MQMHEVSKAAHVPRHPVWVRITHWVGAATFLALVVSGTAILLALPRLFWGETGANEGPAWLTLPLPLNLEQTGWGRNLHFLAAWVFVLNGLAYLLLGLIGGHVRQRLVPGFAEMRPGAILAEIRRHLRPGRPGTPADRYNVIQAVSYLAVIFVLAPTMLLSGLTMSPGVTAAFPELFWLFGGRQSARTIHFLAAMALVLFLVVHVWQVLANRPGRLLQEMTVGAPRPSPERST